MSKGVAVSMMTTIGVLAAAATCSASCVWAEDNVSKVQSCPSAQVYVSVPRAKTTVSAALASATAAGMPVVSFDWPCGPEPGTPIAL
eukprot:SAG31_NODE_29644_length_392_cov_0.703072_1_plen_86_part_01